MALAACPECGGKVSTGAIACPHCGLKLNLSVGEQALAGWAVEVTAGKKEPGCLSQAFGCLILGAAAFGVLCLLLLWWGVRSAPNNPPAPAAPAAPPAPVAAPPPPPGPVKALQPPEPEPARASSPAAQELLDRARRYEGLGLTESALDLYRRVMKEHPGTDQAVSAEARVRATGREP